MRADSPEWLEVAGVLRSFSPTADTGKCGFQLTRVIHGILARHGVNPATIAPLRAGRKVALLLRQCPSETAGIPEVVTASWERVSLPHGWEPVEWSVRRFRWLKRPEPANGHYTTKAQATLATMLLHVLAGLPASNGEVFASVRQLERHCGVQKDVVAATLHIMEHNGVIARVYRGKGIKASRYRVLQFQTEELEDLDVLDVGERLSGVKTASVYLCGNSAPTDEQRSRLEALFG